MSGKIMEMLMHPSELPSLAYMYFAAQAAQRLPTDPNQAFCYRMLNRVSRSFAIVIQQLPEELKDAVCVFYLVLRALDTIEDDMALPNQKKVPELRSFYEHIHDPTFVYPCGYGPYVQLMDEYPKVTAVFLSLKPAYKKVITDITRRMGEGMAEFIEKEVVTVEDFDLYCHYVAGLVGIGLSNLFAGSGLESKTFAAQAELSNEMGLFLQKTNIIRDYLEDINEEPAPRMFWPRDVWGKYASALAAFKEPECGVAAVGCLNELINNALSHVPKALDYMEKLRNPQIFRFCAIPQVMAIGTLMLCYDNIEVFQKVVKLRRGVTATWMRGVYTMDDVYDIFAQCTFEIQAKCQGLRALQGGPENKLETLHLTETILERIQSGRRREAHRRGEAFVDRLAPDYEAPVPWPVRIATFLMFFFYACYAWGVGGVRQAMGLHGDIAAGVVLYGQQALSLVLLVIFTYVLATGKRIGTPDL